MHTFTDKWTVYIPQCKIVITGDLNTRDIRFGSAHTENHPLDPILASLVIINDRNTATRENNTLGVTLGNIRAKNFDLEMENIRAIE